MPASTFRAERLSVAVAVWLAAGMAQAGDWLPLARDGVHDPKSPAIRQLQEPREALLVFPPDTAGNQVRWVDALENNLIAPRSNIRPGTKVQVLDQDILMSLKGGMPIVRFPHRQHTLWLDCSNCHEQLFKSKTGGNKLSMFQILQGEQCGVCHGAVAFPLTECYRCHSVPRPNGRALAPGAPAPPHAKTGEP